MLIRSLKLNHFRNHTDTFIEFSPGMNVITGPNGAGKTSLIDGIHYLCMSRSFCVSSDMYVVQQGESFFQIKGDFEGSIRSRFEVSCNYSRGEGKTFFVNGSKLDRLSDLIGMVPVVTLSPDDKRLTREGPVERRSFLDAFISQISGNYLRDLMDYNRIRKQRNRVLQDYNQAPSLVEAYLEPWTRQLIEKGSAIIFKRNEILNRFKNFLAEDYALVSGIEIDIDLTYDSICEDYSSIEEITSQYRDKLDEAREKELEREQTLVGPHRDEITFYLQNLELRKFGSQGQHRLFALAIKLAQLHFYSEELDDLPILLLDDVFGDLDPKKIEILMQALQQHHGQIFITSANRELFKDHINFDGDENRLFYVEAGKVEQKG